MKKVNANEVVTVSVFLGYDINTDTRNDEVIVTAEAEKIVKGNITVEDAEIIGRDSDGYHSVDSVDWVAEIQKEFSKKYEIRDTN